MKANRLLMLGVVSLMSVSSALAADAPPAFDATYSIVDNHGNNANTHKLSDGAGHTRTETMINNGKTISIVDYPSMTVWTILESQKLITKGPYKGDAEAEGAALLETLPDTTVCGRPCAGKIETVKGGIKKTWTDKALKIMVQTTFTGGGLTRTTSLTSLSTAVPSADNFVVPTDGYTTMNRP